MSLRDVSIKKEYRSLLDNVAKEFYVPLLSEAVSYKRAVAFFSSTVLVYISKGITALVKNGGTIQLIVSPYLSDEDVNAIRNGYSRREIVNNALLKGLREPENKFQAERLNLLANLIADGILEVKVAVTESGSKFGMYHEKMGIITDSVGDKVAFSGSMNESANALQANYEAIDVFTSWSADYDRVLSKECSFVSIWNNTEPNIQTMDFNHVSDEFIKKYKKSAVKYSSLDIEEDKNEHIWQDSSFFKIPETVSLYEYQKSAIATWIKNDFNGIFDMATGTGKTYTALAALSKLSSRYDRLAVVIVCPYQHLVEQWVEDIEFFNVHPIVAYATNTHSKHNWRQLFDDSINAYRSGAVKKFCIITTNATFMLDDFQKRLKKIKNNLCFVVDEAHNFGAEKLRTMMPSHSEFRLALSATVERHRDEKGTKHLFDFFGDKCIEFPLERAIREGYLTEYYYYPVVVSLSDDELDNYLRLTERIKKLSAVSQNDESKQDDIDKLLIRRARIIAGAKSKIEKLIEIMKPYKNDSHMLVYCGATRYDYEEISDTEDKRQIEIVCKLLGEQLNMKVRKFTSDEGKDERQLIKDTFKEGIDLQVVAAIKCLDEGVNIPAIKRAFILASSTNPKEYIQRRGRVLRKAEGKEYAEIFDFITLPRPLQYVQFCESDIKKADLSLITREFNRMLDFANSARNPLDIDNLKEQILSAYGAYNIYSEDE